MSDLVEIFKKSKRFSRMSKRMSKRLSMEQLHIGPYDIIKFLKEGSSSQIYLAESRYTGETVTIKIINKSNIYNNYENLLLITKQIQVLKILKHRNIISLYEIYESKKNIFLITEYISGQDLVQKLIIKKRFSEEETKQIFFQLLDAIIYMHKMKICHRNLRTEHILFDKNNRPKIIGFGYCDFYLNEKKLEGMYGSLCYVCPEILDNQNYDPELADIWSLGVILYVMLCGYLPFSDENDEKNKNLILSGKVDYPKEMSNKVKDLLKHMLDVNIKKRYNFQKILKHPWLKPYNESLFLDGINIYKIKYPIDDRIVNIVSIYGFEKEKIINDLLKNKFNECTAIYKQFVRKALDSKINTASDLCSDIYLKYRSDKKNLISDNSVFEKFISNLKNILKNTEKIVENYKSKEDYVANQLIEIQNIQESRIAENENINSSSLKSDNKNKLRAQSSEKLLENIQDKIGKNVEITYNVDDDVDILGQFKKKQHSQSSIKRKKEENKIENLKRSNLAKSTNQPNLKKFYENEEIKPTKTMKMTIKPNSKTDKFISKILNGTFFDNYKFRKSRLYSKVINKEEKNNNINHLEQGSNLDNFLKQNHPDNVRKTLIKMDLLGSKMDDIFEDDEEKNDGAKENKKLRYSIDFDSSDEDVDAEEIDSSIYSNNNESDEKIMDLLNKDPEFKELKDLYYGKKSIKKEKKNDENSKNNDDISSKNVKKSIRSTFMKSNEEKKDNIININKKETFIKKKKSNYRKESNADNKNNTGILNNFKKKGQKSGKSVRFKIENNNSKNVKNEEKKIDENTSISKGLPNDFYITVTENTEKNCKNDDLNKNFDDKDKTNIENSIVSKSLFSPLNIKEEIRTDRLENKFSSFSPIFIFDISKVNNMKNIDNNFLFDINSLEQKRDKKNICIFNDDNKNKVKKFRKKFKKNITNKSIIDDFNDINSLFYKKHFKKYKKIYPPEIKKFKNLKITREEKCSFEKYENKKIDLVKVKKNKQINSIRNNLNKIGNSTNTLDTNEINRKNNINDSNENLHKIKSKNLNIKKIHKKMHNSVQIVEGKNIMSNINQTIEEPKIKYKKITELDDRYKAKTKINKLKDSDKNYSSEKYENNYNNNTFDGSEKYFIDNFNIETLKPQSSRKKNKSNNKTNYNKDIIDLNIDKSIPKIKKINSKKHIRIIKSKEKEREIHTDRAKILKNYETFNKNDKKLLSLNKNGAKFLEKQRNIEPYCKIDKFKSQLKRYEDRSISINKNKLNNTASLEKIKNKKKLNNSAKNREIEEIVKRNEIMKKILHCQNILNNIMTDKNNFTNHDNNNYETNLDENYNNTTTSWNINNSKEKVNNNSNNEAEIARRKYKKIKKKQKHFSINLNTNNNDTFFVDYLATRNKIKKNRKRSVDDIQINDYIDISIHNNSYEIDNSKNNNKSLQLKQKTNLVKKINNIKNTTITKGKEIKKENSICYRLNNTNKDNNLKTNKENNIFTIRKSIKNKDNTSFMGNAPNVNNKKINKNNKTNKI